MQRDRRETRPLSLAVSCRPPGVRSSLFSKDKPQLKAGCFVCSASLTQMSAAQKLEFGMAPLVCLLTLCRARTVAVLIPLLKRQGPGCGPPLVADSLPRTDGRAAFDSSVSSNGNTQLKAGRFVCPSSLPLNISLGLLSRNGWTEGRSRRKSVVDLLHSSSQSHRLGSRRGDG